MVDTVTIIIEPGEDGWWVSRVAEVPGAISQGRTVEEAREMALDALNEVMLANRELALRQKAADAQVESVSLVA